MSTSRRNFFTLQELLILAALAALGGVSSSVLSRVGQVLAGFTGMPGGLQFLAGIHVLWLVLALGLVRKPGAATACALLKGVVELLSGSSHGLIAVVLSGLAGLCVDGVWLLAGGRLRAWTCVLAGGVGAASNILVFKLVMSLPDHRGVTIGLAVLTGVAFVSGALLAGVLGWALLLALRRAGAAGAQAPGTPLPGSRRVWTSVGLAAASLMLCGVAIYLAHLRAPLDGSTDRPAPTSAPSTTMTSE